jgi:hypothetical protein
MAGTPHPDFVVPRRNGVAGSPVVPALVPGELWVDATPGAPVLWLADGDRVPFPVTGGGGGTPFDDSHLLALDGSRPMEGGLDMDDHAIGNAIAVETEMLMAYPTGGVIEGFRIDGGGF